MSARPVNRFHAEQGRCFSKTVAVFLRTTRTSVKCSLKQRLIMSKERGRFGEGVRKPAGGFCFVSGIALLSAWAAYRSGRIRLIDLRVWFACLEAVARRCGLGEGRAPRYRIEELGSLMGGTPVKHIRRSVAKLDRAKLMYWSESSIRILDAKDVANDEELIAMLDSVPNCRRLVPVPRRVVRLIARGARKVLIATILGHLLRCMYYKRGLCLPEGTCKASWIADVFRVDARNVKAARKHLIALGWLIPIATRQWHLNRFGARVRINLGWSGNDVIPASERSPLPVRFGTGSPPPNKNKELSSRMKNNQKPGSRNTAGVQKQENSKPTLRNVRLEDLSMPGRLSALLRQAVKEKLVRECEADRLKFFAAAEHARVIATTNPCGLFVTVVRRGLWAYISQSEEDAARRTLQHVLESDAVANYAYGRNAGMEQVQTKSSPSATRATREDFMERAEIREIVQRSLAEGAPTPRCVPWGLAA